MMLNSEFEDACEEDELELSDTVPEDWILEEDAQVVLTELQEYIDSNALMDDKDYVSFFNTFIEHINPVESAASDSDGDVELYNLGDVELYNLGGAEINNLGDANPNNLGDAEPDNLGADGELKPKECKITGKGMKAIIAEQEAANHDRNSRNWNQEPVVTSSKVIVENGFEPIAEDSSPSDLNTWIKENAGRAEPGLLSFQSRILAEKKQYVEVITLETSDSADRDVEIESEWDIVLEDTGDRTNKRKRKREHVQFNISDDSTETNENDVRRVKKILKLRKRGFEALPAISKKRKRIKAKIYRCEVENCDMRFTTSIACRLHSRLHDFLTNPEDFLLPKRPRIVSSDVELEIIRLD